MTRQITAHELFARLAHIIPKHDQQPFEVMHELLVLTAEYGTAESRISFGNLFSRVAYLCKKHHLPDYLTQHIQAMRRDSNRHRHIEADLWGEHCRALALLIATVFAESIPEEVLRHIPKTFRHHRTEHHTFYHKIRGIVVRIDREAHILYVDCEQEEGMAADCSDEKLCHNLRLAWEGMQVNLLDCTMTERYMVKPSLIIFEPDYTVNISALANCFSEYGTSPLQYIIRRFLPVPATKATLLGNFAGAILDDSIHQRSKANWKSTLNRHFRQYIFDYLTCEDFEPEAFKKEAALQAANIAETVHRLFDSDKPQGNAAPMLEPSFICEELGLYGRVDLMTSDFKLLVEQKSGKNFNLERGCPDKYGHLQLEKHYVQLILYFGVLQRNFHIRPSKTDIMLFYSRYKLPASLINTAFFFGLFAEAMYVRNRIVSLIYGIAQKGFDSFLTYFTPEIINEQGISGSFWQNYIRPKLQAVTDTLFSLDDTEKAYVSRMLTFAAREELHAKTGDRQNHGNASADLWNLPLAQKKDNGSIFTGLHIANRKRSSEISGYDSVELTVPQQEKAFLPNMRIGDSVYLYAYREGEEPDVRKAVLFPGNITMLSSSNITVQLTNGQKTKDIFNISVSNADEFSEQSNISTEEIPAPNTQKKQKTRYLYAVEKSNGEIGSESAFRSLYRFASADKDFRNLILGRRNPHADTSIALSRTHHPHYDHVVLKAKQAQDYFLLIGPPGTGKTSMALRFMVEEHDTDDLLLMAYTNRAVDEICAMLEDAGKEYLRIGNPHVCDVRFRKRLIDRALSGVDKLKEMRGVVQQIHIFVGTTSAMQHAAALFDIKRFTCAIIDEASQILEPSLVGLLALVPKFILIGDHKQLPAVVQQNDVLTKIEDPCLKEAGFADCKESLFQRLIRLEQSKGRTAFSDVLRYQGRMHPEIAGFSSEMFYKTEQISAVPIAHQKDSRIYPEGCVCQAAKLDTFLHQHRNVFIPSPDCVQDTVWGKANPAEAFIIAHVLRSIRRSYGTLFDPSATVGVIVPYRNQISMIRQALEAWKDPLLSEINIDTVERYQGSQRDVMVYSLTVQRRYQLDFLKASSFYEQSTEIDRKLNVALTRAKRQMIVVGNEEILCCDDLYRKLIAHYRQMGGYYGAFSEKDTEE